METEMRSESDRIARCVVGVTETRHSNTIVCSGGLDVIRKEAWSFYRTISGVCLCWELEKPKGPKKEVRIGPKLAS